jgi:hypothetical protein
MTRYLLTDPDDPENFYSFLAATEADALDLARGEDGDVEWACEEVTPEMRRAWRNQERRERYAANPPPSRAKPASDAAKAWYAGLSMMTTMGMHDERGRLRCSCCRRFATLDDLSGSETTYAAEGIRVHYGPHCRRCRA